MVTENKRVAVRNIVVVDRLVRVFPIRGRGNNNFLAVDRVSFTLEEGDTLGLVGETGAGKSTIGRCILGLETPSAGCIELFGETTASLSTRSWKAMRRQMQAVFQDPKGAMNPRWTVKELVAEPLRRVGGVSPAEVEERVERSLLAVGLGRPFLGRYRHQLSGGEQQRVNIARAVAVEPRLIILDEPVSALDSSIKRDIVKLLDALRRDKKLAYLMISHDLDVVRILCRRMIVLFRGRIVEMGPVRALSKAAAHPYTKQLFAAQLGLPHDDSAAPGVSDGNNADWTLENDLAQPKIGDLVQIGDEHFVAS
jgi:ABC-type oligopeptide transport system ATPase subunit